MPEDRLEDWVENREVPADRQSKQAFTRAPMIDLQAQAKGPTRED